MRWPVLHSAAVTPEVIERARSRYLLFGNMATKGKSAVTPWNLAEKMATFSSQRLLPLDTTAQGTLVRMLRTGLYYPGRSWTAPSGGRGTCVKRLNAHLRLLTSPVDCFLDDVAILFFDTKFVPWSMDDATEGVPLTARQLAANGIRLAAAAAGEDGEAPLPEYTHSDRVLSINIERVKSLIAPGRDWRVGESPRVSIHIGPSGAGKSRYVFQTLANSSTSFYMLNAESGVTLWFDGYEEHKVVVGNDIIDTDDGDKALIKFRIMKQLVDYQPALMQTRDGFPARFVPLKNKWSIFTATVPPECWYLNADGEMHGEWRRRLEEFGEIFEHTQWGVPPVRHTGAQYIARVLARQQRERERERELAEERLR